MANKKIMFEDFWKNYPVHIGKKDAERVWNKMTATDRHAAYNGIDRYRKHCEQTGEFFKHPQGWLKGRRWEDTYEDRPAGAKKDVPPSPPAVAGDMDKW